MKINLNTNIIQNQSEFFIAYISNIKPIVEILNINYSHIRFLVMGVAEFEIHKYVN